MALKRCGGHQKEMDILLDGRQVDLIPAVWCVGPLLKFLHASCADPEAISQLDGIVKLMRVSIGFVPAEMMDFLLTQVEHLFNIMRDLSITFVGEPFEVWNLSLAAKAEIFFLKGGIEVQMRFVADDDLDQEGSPIQLHHLALHGQALAVLPNLGPKNFGHGPCEAGAGEHKPSGDDQE